MAEGEVEKSAWNLSQQIITLISQLIEKSSNNFRKGMIQESYFDTQEIRNVISNHLSSDEDRGLDRMEDKITRSYNQFLFFLKAYRSDQSAIANKVIARKRYNLYVAQVKYYRRAMMKLLGKYGFDVQKKEDSSRMF